MLKTLCELTFKDDVHEYRLNGVVIPSVTQILQWSFRSFDGVKDHFLEKASWRGQCVHKAIELLELGCLDWNTLDPQFIPYVEAWKLFKQQTGFISDTTQIERHSYHPVYKYGMTPDIPGFLDEVPAIIDLKTGEVQHIAALQLAAYQEGINANKPDHKIKRRMALQLKDNGQFKMKEYTNKADFNTFLCAMAVYNWKGNH